MTRTRKVFTKTEDKVLRQSITIGEMAEQLGRSYGTIFARINKLGITSYKKISPSERARLAHTAREANKKSSNTILTKSPGKVVKSKSDFKFVLNGIPVTIGANVKNAHVGVDRIEINF